MGVGVGLTGGGKGGGVPLSAQPAPKRGGVGLSGASGVSGGSGGGREEEDVIAFALSSSCRGLDTFEGLWFC